MGEPTRAAILLALMDGRALPAGELASAASLSAAATSIHLGKLTNAGLLAVEQEGRHRYYKLASVEVAYALEALGAIATKPTKAALSPERAALRHARTCYDHLAGEVAVALLQSMTRDRVLRADPSGDRTFAITPHGAKWLEDKLALDVRSLTPTKRPFARRCIDWTERRPHLAGTLGAAILEAMLEKRLVARMKGIRTLRVTTRGETFFAALSRA